MVTGRHSHSQQTGNFTSSADEHEGDQKLLYYQMHFPCANATKMRWRPGLLSGPCSGSLQRSPDPLAGFQVEGKEGRR